MFIETCRFHRTLGVVVVSLLFRIQSATFKEMYRLIKHTRIAGRQHITTGGIRQPQIVVGEMRAHALPVGRMPPVLHVTLQELAPGATEQLLAGEPRCCMDQRHGVLQLIAETIGAAGLVIPAASPEPARQCLVEQPAVRHHIQSVIRRLHLHRAQGAVPVFPHRFQRLPGAGRAAVLLDEMLRFIGVAGGAEDEHDLALLPVGQFDPGLYRGARIETRTCPARQTRAAHRRRTGQRAVAADEFLAVAGHRTFRAR